MDQGWLEGLALLFLIARLIVELLRGARLCLRCFRRCLACGARVGAGLAMPGLTHRTDRQLDRGNAGDLLRFRKQALATRQFEAHNLLALAAARGLAD